MMELIIERITPTLARITCEGGKVLDIKSGQAYSEVVTECRAWQTDEQVLVGYKAINQNRNAEL